MESADKQIQRIKRGLPITFFNSICKDIELNENRLASIIKTSASTLTIRKKEGVFSLSESERLLRIRLIYNKALEVFENEKVVQKWLKNPYWLIDNIAPIDYLDTEIGGREIEKILHHLKNGLFTFALPV